MIFFNIPEVSVVNADCTCVWSNDSLFFKDDLFGFNRDELMSIGISGEDYEMFKLYLILSFCTLPVHQ